MLQQVERWRELLISRWGVVELSIKEGVTKRGLLDHGQEIRTRLVVLHPPDRSLSRTFSPRSKSFIPDSSQVW